MILHTKLLIFCRRLKDKIYYKPKNNKYEINLTNILQNYRALSAIAKNAIAAAVVKDDSYGLGAEVIAPMLYNEAGCRYFFVAHAIEAERISPLIPEAKIYVLQGIGADSIDVFRKNKNISRSL